MRWVRRGFAIAVAGVTSWLGQGGVAEGTRVRIAESDLGIDVTATCALTIELAGILAMLWAVRLPLSFRAWWSVVFLAGWAAVNIVRISTILALSRSSSIRFELLHDWFWPVVSGSLVAGVLLQCRRWDAAGADPQSSEIELSANVADVVRPRIGPPKAIE